MVLPVDLQWVECIHSIVEVQRKSVFSAFTSVMDDTPAKVYSRRRKVFPCVVNRKNKWPEVEGGRTREAQ